MSKKNAQEPPIKKNAFVHKLYSMLNDPKLSHLIWWTRNEESNTFALSPGKEFANALTGYFKHGNVASFVRQLHMYGFHKVSDPQSTDPNASNPSSSLMATNNKDNFPIWEFKHSSGKFKKNDESSLIYIKRRSSSNSSRNSVGYSNENDTSILIPTSSPSPNSFDNLHHHTFHFGQHPQAHPPAHHLHPSGYIQHGPHVYYGGPPPPGPPQPHTANSSPSGPFLPQGIPQPHHHPHQIHHIPYSTNQHTMPYAFTSNPVPLEQYQHQPQPHHIPHQGQLQHHQMHQIVQQIPSGSPSNVQHLPLGTGHSQHHHPHHVSQGPVMQYHEQEKRPFSPALLDNQYETGLRQSSSYTSLPQAEHQEAVSTNIPRHNSDPQRASLYPVGSQSSEQQPQQQTQHRQQTPTQSYGVTPGGTAIQAQRYTPSLQFRKIWETSNPSSRPRNPSLLFDPLAPAPHHGSTSAPSVHHAQSSYSPAPDVSMKAPPRGASIASPPPHSSTQQQYQPYQQQQSMHAPPPPPPAQLTGAALVPGRSDSASSFSSARDSIDSTRSSIKLPPPSSIHRVSSNLAFPPSPDMKDDEPESISGNNSISSASEKTTNSASKVKSAEPPVNTSISSNSSGNHAPSIPGSPSSSFSKKPSLVPISSSIHERLRPSLIELHLGSGATTSGSGSAPSSLPGSASAPSSNSFPNSLSSVSKLTGTGVMKLQSDSIGSHSSNNNSIFSNKSSLSSMSSAQRTSSFGSISIDANKNSISIGPHDPIPSSGLTNGSSLIGGMHAPETINEDEVANSSSVPANQETAPPVQFPRPRSPSSLSSAPLAPRPKMFRSLTPPSKFQQKAQQIHSPVPRSSTSISASHHHNNNHQPHFHSTLRSLTHSPLSQSVVNDGDLSSETSEKDKVDASEDTSRKRTNIINSIKAIKNKVSVDSLLGNNDNIKYSDVNSIINESGHETETENDNVNDHEEKNATVSKDVGETTDNSTIPTSASEENKLDQEIKRQRLE